MRCRRLAGVGQDHAAAPPRHANGFGIGDVNGTPRGKTAATVRKSAPMVAHERVEHIAGRKPAEALDGYAGGEHPVGNRAESQAAARRRAVAAADGGGAPPRQARLARRLAARVLFLDLRNRTGALRLRIAAPVDAGVALMCRKGDRSSRGAERLADGGCTRGWGVVDGFDRMPSPQ